MRQQPRTGSRAAMRTMVAFAWASTVAQAATALAIGAGIDAVVNRGLTVGDIALPVTLALVAGALAAVPIAIGAHHQSVVETGWRQLILAQLARLGLADRDDKRTGRVVSSATDGVERAGAHQGGFSATIIAALSGTVLVLVIVAVAIDPVIAAWLTLGAIIAPVLIGWFHSAFRSVSRRYRAEARHLSAAFLDAIQSLASLSLARADTRATDDLADGSEVLRRRVMRMLAGNQLVLFGVDTVLTLALPITALACALTSVGDGTITVGQGIAVVALSVIMLDSIDRVAQFFYIAMGGMAAVREIRTYLAREPGRDAGALGLPAQHHPISATISHGEPDPVPPGDPTPAAASAKGRTTSSGARVEFDSVEFGYTEQPVLRGASFTIEPGEHVALVGPSGAGKSTIAALVLGERHAGSGRVLVDGVDLASVPDAWPRSRCALVSQRTYLFTGTIGDNLRLAKPEATRAEIERALEIAELTSFVHERPEGLDTLVGERGMSLSGGQAARIAIARAVLRDAPILILDEPTANVDLHSEAAIMRGIEHLGEGRTVLTISHRATTTAFADRTIALREGRIVPAAAPGSPHVPHPPGPVVGAAAALVGLDDGLAGNPADDSAANATAEVAR